MAETSTNAPVLVLGIGNILLQDEGVGVHLVQILQGLKLPAGVEVADGGTSGFDLLDLIAKREKLIIIDAADIDGPPGSFTKLSPDEFAIPIGGISLHDFGLAELLAVAKRLELLPGRVVVFAVKPETIGPGLDLSDTVKNALPHLVAAILDELNAEN